MRQLDDRRTDKVEKVCGKTFALGTGDDLVVEAAVNVVCQEAAGTEQISPDATIAVPSTIGPSSHAATTDQIRLAAEARAGPV